MNRLLQCIQPVHRKLLSEFVSLHAVYLIVRTIRGTAEVSIPFSGEKVVFNLPDYYSYKWIIRNKFKNYNGWHEPSLTALFEIMVKNHRVFFDIGAHIGYYSLLFSSIDGHRSIALEPMKENFNRLKWVCVSSDVCDSIELYECAATNFIGEASLTSGGLVPSTASLLSHPSASSEQSLTVRATTLAALADSVGMLPDLIKIDVEGAEGCVIAGSIELLKNLRPTLILEVHKNHINDFNSMNYESIIDNLKSIGYSLFVFEHYRSAQLTPLRELPAVWNPINFDIVAVQNDKYSIIQEYNSKTLS